MKEIGSHIFYEDVDLNLKFDFDDLAKFHGADETGIKETLLDENGHIKMDVLEELVEVYVNAHVTDKFGEDFSLDVMDNTMNISWDIDVKSIKEKHIENWWDKKNLPKKSNALENGKIKPKTLEDEITQAVFNPSSIPEGLPEHRK